jgi:hypothetical protein
MDSSSSIVNKLWMLRRCTAMHQGHQLIVFTPDEQRDAVPLFAVARMVRLVEITPVLHTPKILLSVIDILPILLTQLSGAIAARLGLHFPKAR